MIAILLIAGVAYLVIKAMSDAVNPNPIPTTGTLTPAQLATLAQNAGFTDNDLATAVAVALAESGGKVTAYNPEKAAGTAQGRGSYGLWQIYLTAHPEYTADQLLDPQQNANAAYKVYVQAGYSFGPWSTYTGGQYMTYASQAQDATGQQVS